jgi:hypothetical protein
MSSLTAKECSMGNDDEEKPVEEPPRKNEAPQRLVLPKPKDIFDKVNKFENPWNDKPEKVD